MILLPQTEGAVARKHKMAAAQLSLTPAIEVLKLAADCPALRSQFYCQRLAGGFRIVFIRCRFEAGMHPGAERSARKRSAQSGLTGWTGDPRAIHVEYTVGEARGLRHEFAESRLLLDSG